MEISAERGPSDQYGKHVQAYPSFQWRSQPWNVSQVTDMGYMFAQAFDGDQAAFNADLSHWDVSQVTKMAQMFNGAEAFNGDLSGRYLH